MKKIIYGLGLASLCMILIACSKEDDPQPSGIYDNAFAVPDDATDETSILCRNFHERTGIYLLFNDTLSRQLIGKDPYGKDIWKVETVDFNYNLTSDAGETYRFSYIEKLDGMRSVIDFLENRIIPHLGDGILRPYSILPFGKIETYSRRKWKEIDFANCMRCLGLNMRTIVEGASEEELDDYANTLLKAIVSARFNYSSDEAEAFLEISDKYYWEIISDHIDWDRDYPEDVYNLGFMDYTPDFWEDAPAYDEFIGPDDDFNMFFSAVMEMDEDEFLDQWGEYPVIVQKYRLMKNIIIGLGYEF